VQIGAILGRESGKAEGATRHRDAFMTGQAATNDDLAIDLWWCNTYDAEFHSAPSST